MYKENRQPVYKHITPKEAQEFLALNNFPGQRAYNALKGKLYADNMESGAHRRVDIAVALVEETKTRFLMNGQHNCNAILIRDKPFPGIVSYYSCDTMLDAWRLFATFDVHAARTERQFMHGRRGIFKDERLQEVPLSVLQVCGTALLALGGGTSPMFHGTRTKTDKADCVEKYAEDVIRVAEYRLYPHLMQAGVAAAIIATFRKNKNKAIEFWGKVGSGEMLTKSDHRMKLKESLQGMKKTGRVKTHGGGKERHRAMFALCISWWNSWVTNEPRNAVKIKSMDSLPKVLE